MTQYNQSEVARLKAQIEAEIQAAQWALHGASLGTAQHQFITCRMERMGMLHEELKELVGEEEGIRLLIQAMDIKGAAPAVCQSFDSSEQRNSQEIQGSIFLTTSVSYKGSKDINKL